MIEMTFPWDTRVLVWRLDEQAPQLLDLCRAADIPVGDLIDMPVKRQREKAAERLLLRRALGSPVIPSYTSQGAPYIEASPVNISITHTQCLVVVAVNESGIIGIDAEPMDRKQVLRVRDKFLNASEQEFINPDDQTAHIIAWTAKEAVIKAERNSAIDWTDGICLEPFVAEDFDARELAFAARCGGRRYHLVCRQVEGHCLTLAVACNQ